MDNHNADRTADGLDYEEIHATVSDLHMSAGVQGQLFFGLPWYRRAGRAVSRLLFRGQNIDAVSNDNPLEDFPDDRPLVEFLDRLTERYAARAKRLRLKLLGDNFDPHAVLWEGDLGGPPYETVAVHKMKKIIAGHGAAMDALSSFLDRPNCYLDIYAGNHDLFLVWPRVQHRLIRRLAGRDPKKAARIRFFGPAENFQELDRGIMYYHGMNAEAQNSIYPDKVILKDQYGIPLRRPLLNEPYGSHLTTKLVYRIKLYNDLISRLADYRSIFRTALVHDWGWSVYVLLMTVWSYVYHSFFALWHIRRQARWRDMVRIISQAVVNEGVDDYARKQLTRPEVNAVVMGHSHAWRQESSKDGTYINTGSWSLMFRMVQPRIELKWRRFRWLEKIGRSIYSFLTTRHYAFGVQLSKMLAWLALVAIMIASLVSGFPQEGWHLSGLKWVIGIALAYVMAAGILRVLSAKPDLESIQRYTFCLARFHPDGQFDLRLMEYQPDKGDFRQCH